MEDGTEQLRTCNPEVCPEPEPEPEPEPAPAPPPPDRPGTPASDKSALLAAIFPVNSPSKMMNFV